MAFYFSSMGGKILRGGVGYFIPKCSMGNKQTGQVELLKRDCKQANRAGRAPEERLQRVNSLPEEPQIKIQIRSRSLSLFLSFSWI